MGGRSSSSNAQTQETTTLESDGVIVGDLFQGKSVTVNQDFPDAVGEAFNQLVDLAGSAISLAGQAGGRALDNAESAIDRVADRSEFAQSPEFQTLDRYIPVAMLAVLAAGVYFVFTKGN